MSLLSSSVATLPVKLVDDEDDVRNAKTLPPSPLLTEPYSEISPFEWRVQFVASLALRGEFFGEIISRDRQLYPTQIKPVPADNAKVRRKLDGTLEYTFWNKPVPLKNVFHVKLLTLPGMLHGVNPIQYLRLTFSKSLAQSTYGAKYFANSANPSLVIKVKGKLSPDQVKRMVRTFMANHQGLGNAHLPAVLTDDSDITPITISPQDSQFIQAMGFSAEEISGTIYRVPPHMIGLNEKVSSWGKGLEQMEMGFTKNTLVDYTARYEQALTALHPPGQFVKLDLSHRLRGDTLERSQAASLGTLGGFLTPNNARSWLDLPDLPDGDKLNSPINTELLEKAIAETEQAMKAKDEPAPPPQQAPVPPAQGGRQ